MKEFVHSLFRGNWISTLIIVVFAWNALHQVDRLGRWRASDVLGWDVESYYHYLPATFIHGDPFDLSYVAALDSLLHPDGSHSRFGIQTHPTTHRDVIKFSCGTALFELPFFLVAHAFTLATDPQHADGYSPPYQLAVCLSTVLFVTWGLFLLRGFLLRHVPDRDASVALFAIALGTNLFFYASNTCGMSHGYLFFLFAAILYLTDKWHRAPRACTAAWLGVSLGLTLLVRPVDALVVVVPLLWRHNANGKWTSTITLLRTRPRDLLVATGCALVVCVPQLIYWKLATGDILFYSYQEEGFDFSSPHIIEGLFSYKKGWLVYSPLVALGLLGLLVMLFDRRSRPYALPVIVFLPLMCYVVFSWHLWWYGGSFGCRPMISALALLALPIALLSASAFKKHWALGAALVLVVVCGVRLNLFQQRQYEQNIIHWEAMTRERYWEVFGVDSWDHLTPFP